MMVWAAALLAALAMGILVYVVIAHRPSTAAGSDIILQQRFQQQRGSVTASAVGLADRLLSRVRREQVAVRLSVAGLSLRPAEWSIVRVVVALGLGALGM